MRSIAILISFFLTTTALAQNPPAGAASAAAAIPADPQGIPRDVLDQMDRTELGPLYTPQIAPKLYDAHRALEACFAAETKADRQSTLKQLEGLAIDPNILGRLARIRLYWPALRPGVYYINERVGPHDVIYFLGIPAGYDRAKPSPLVIKLPGAHAFVSNPPPGKEEVARIYTGWIQEELRLHPDAVILMPLLNLDELWGPSYKGMNSVIQPLYHVAGRVNVDLARVYMFGQGMSAHGTWSLTLHYPTYFAAILPMAGSASEYFQRVRFPNLRNIYCVVWHDADDQVVKVEGSRGVVAALKKLKYDVDYQETKGIGHSPSEQLAQQLYQKMRSRTRPLYPKEVALGSNRPDTQFNRVDWLQVYQQAFPGKEKKASIVHGSGMIMLQENAYTITATITGPNRIELRSGNVDSLRIYVNDQMIDFAKPVTVVMNNRVRFEGMVKPSIAEMLADQVFLGRGWRYFTGIIDIELPPDPTTTRPSTPQQTGRPGKPTSRPGIQYTPPTE